MKDSGIEWIGEIPEEWKVIHNKYLLTKHKELIEKYNDENILSLTLNGVIIRNLNDGGKMPSSFVGYQKLYKGNLLLCLFDIDVTPRCVGLIKSDGITSPAYSQYEVNSKVADVRYYYYYFLMLDNKKVLVHMGKSLRSSISNDQFGNINSILPPKSQQIEIADYLDKKVFEINQASQTIQQEIDALEEYRKSIITETVTKGLDKTVPMKDSGIEWIGKIPENWKSMKLKFLSDKIDRGTPPNYTKEHITKVVNQATFSKGFFDKSDIKFSSINANQSRGLLKKKDILIASTGGGVLGKTLYYQENDTYVADSHVTIMRINSEKYNSKLIYYLLSVNYELINGTMAQGSTNQIELQKNLLANFYVPYIPDEKERKRIVEFLDNNSNLINRIIENKKEQLKILTQYKQSIIYEYVTGKKQVPEKEGVKNAQ